MGLCSIGRMPWKDAKASVTFRLTSLLVIEQRQALLQYFLALSKSSLNGVQGGFTYHSFQ